MVLKGLLQCGGQQLLLIFLHSILELSLVLPAVCDKVHVTVFPNTLCTKISERVSAASILIS